MANSDPMPPELVMFFAVMMAVTRGIIYCGSATSPLNLWGRVSTGNIIIPGYDQIFVAPILAIGLVFVALVASRFAEAATPVFWGFTMAAVVFTVLGTGPTMRNWTLTGNLRFGPPKLSGSTKGKLKAI